MEMLVKNLRILWRTERLLTEMKLRALMQRASLMALAAVMGLFAVAMLNVAGYLYLAPRLEPTGAALVVAAVDAVLAIVLVIVAQPGKPGTETRMLEEVRDMAVADLEEGAKSIESDIREVRAEIDGVRQSVSSFARNPIETISPQLITTIMTLLMRLLRSKKD